MKPLPLFMLLLLPLALAPRAPIKAPSSAPTVCGSLPPTATAPPGPEPSWTRAYIPLRSCHRLLRGPRGEFSPPGYRSSSPVNVWCNWTIWAGSRQHIVIYIRGFTAAEGCERNEDKILFEGVSSAAADGALYACWRQDTHVFATLATAVHVVLLQRHVPGRCAARFRGTYYLFKHHEGAPAPVEGARAGTAWHGALPGREPLLGSGRAPLAPGHPGLGIRATHPSALGSALPPWGRPPSGGASGEEGVGPVGSLGLRTARWEQSEGCPLPSRGAMGSLAESLEPSLSARMGALGEGCTLRPPGSSFPAPCSEAGPGTSALQPTAPTGLPAPGSLGDASEVEKLLHPPGSWAVPKDQPEPSARSSRLLQAAPTEPGSGDHAPRVSAVQGRAPWGAASALGTEVALVPVCPQAGSVCADPGSVGLPWAWTPPMEQGVPEPSSSFSTRAEDFPVPPARELGAAAEGTGRPVPSAPWTSAACGPLQGGDLVTPLTAASRPSPGVSVQLVLDADGAGGAHGGEAPASTAWVDGESFPTARDLQLHDLRLAEGLHPCGATPLLPPVPLSPEPPPHGLRTPGAGQRHKHAELGPPWAMEYFPVRSCHVVLQGEFGLFSPPLHSDIETNIWCNWTIRAGPRKHILIYIQGFRTDDGCDENQDKMIFQGVSSSVETQVVYACYNRGTVIFAAPAAAVHVGLLAGSGSLGSKYEHFKGRYYVFGDPAAEGSSRDVPAPAWGVSKTDVSKLGQHRDLQEGSDGGEFSLLEEEMELERSLGGGEEVLVEPAAAAGDAGRNARVPALGPVEGGAQPEPTRVPAAPCSPTDVPWEAPRSSARPSAPRILPSPAQTPSSLRLGVTTVPRRSPTPTVVTEGPPLDTNAEPSPLYPSLGMTAGGAATAAESLGELFDPASVLASLDNHTVLQSQHHPGDVLFEVTVEIKHMDWIPHGGRELDKDLLESMKSHIQKNLKLSANRVNEIRVKEVRRVGRENLLLTFWLHLRPEERNLSLALRSQLQELLSKPAGAGRPRLVSLLVEDVNECGLGLCGEAADCFNGVGTYLCRCKEHYEDRSPTKSGTLCVPVPRSGLSSFFRQPEVLVGAVVSVGLVLLVALLVLHRVTRRRRSRGNPFLEELGARSEEAEVVMELSHLEDCLRLEPFQLKVRARPPEWISRASRAPGLLVQHEETL